jgi:SPX domain protein involved in polyphosphate accumulation
MSGEEERNRLKEEYKAHYLKIRELKNKLAEAERVKKITNAVQQINPQGLIDQFDEALDKVREKVFIAEAKLDMAMESADADDHVSPADEETLRKQRASETLKQMKMELGMLNDAIEEQAANHPAQKTLGKKPSENDSLSNPLSPNTSSKSLGRPQSDH